MLCPHCGNDAGSELACGSCGLPVTGASTPAPADDEVVWSAEGPTVPTVATPVVTKDPTGPGIPRDPTSPSAARPRPAKDVLMKRRLMAGGAVLVAIALLIVIIVLATGGDSKDSSPDTTATPTSDASGPTGTDSASGPATTSAGPTTLAPVGSMSIDESVVLVKGSTGPQVQAVQEALAARGYEVTINAVYDDATVSAVKQFQRNVNLPIVGKAGPSTRATLGLGIDKETGFNSYKAAVEAVVTYLNKGTYSLLPKDALKGLYAFRTITKGKKIVWSLESLEVSPLLAEPFAGQAVAALKLYNESTKNSHTVTICFTKEAPITWCGVWKYD